jgi:cell division protein FtsI (penicillin-binding protein 3)
VDEPEVSVYGGVVAAPVFRNVARGALRHLSVAPQQLSPIPSAVGQTEVPFRRAPNKAIDVAFDEDAFAVPDFVGLSLREAVEKARTIKMKVKMQGNGYVVKQSPTPGARWSNNQVLILDLQG